MKYFSHFRMEILNGTQVTNYLFQPHLLESFAPPHLTPHHLLLTPAQETRRQEALEMVRGVDDSAT